MPSLKSLILFGIFMGYSTLAAFSQERVIFTKDYLDPFITNPACTGAEDYPVVHLAAEKKLVGFTGSPSTFLLSGNYRIGNYDFYNPKGLLNKGPLKLKDRVGLGGAIFQDSYGPLTNLGGLLSYGYHLPMHHNARLSFGLSMLLAKYSLANSMLNPDQVNDSYIFSGNTSKFNFNLGTGIYYHSNKIFVGASIYKLLPDLSQVNQPIAEHPNYFIHGGYRFNNPGKDFNLELSAAFKKLSGEKTIVDLHSKIYVKRISWFALSYSSTKQANIQFALRIYRAFYMGYNYGFTFNKIASYNYGSHEISLGINLGLFANYEL